jgi:hypothetical protein
MVIPQFSDFDSPFGVCHVMKNTANLWGRGIIQVSLGLNTAFALTYDGNILTWVRERCVCRSSLFCARGRVRVRACILCDCALARLTH